MSNIWLKILLPLLLISSGTSVYSQISGPGYDPAPLEIKPVAKNVPRHITSKDLLNLRDVVGIKISPDGKSIAYVVSQAVLESNSYRTALFVVSTDPGSMPINLGSAGPAQWDFIGQYKKIAPQWSPNSKYITYLMGEKDKRQVWMWSREGGKPEQLTHNPADVDSYEWHPDGKQIIFTTVEPITPEEIKRVSEHGILYDSYGSADWFGSIRAWEARPIARAALETKPRKRQTWIYDLTNKAERNFTQEEEEEYRKLHQPPSVYIPGETYIAIMKPSPNGKRIAYVSMLEDPNKSILTYSISIKDVAGNRSYEIVPPSKEYVGELWWGKESDQVYFTRETEDSGWGLYAVATRGGAVQEVIKNNEDFLSELSFDESMVRVACLRETPTTPGEVAVLDLRAGGVRSLVNVNPEFQNITLAPATKLDWTNKYGDHAFGYLIKPLNYESGKRSPLIVTTYSARGFIRGNVGDEYPAQVFAANGFAVLCMDLIDADIRIAKPGNFEVAKLRLTSAMESLEQATKSLEEMGVIDPQHKGLGGLSYGSEVTNFTISHSDLFQAAVVSSAAAQSPILYYLANGHWHKRLARLGLGGLPDGEAAERWKELSPALNATRIKAPLLFQSADSEYIPGLQLYTTLKVLGKPAEMIIYADELHIKNQPKHKYEVYQRNVDWFNFWLQGKEDTDPARREQYTRWRALRDTMQSNQTATTN